MDMVLTRKAMGPGASLFRIGRLVGLRCQRRSPDLINWRSPHSTAEDSVLMLQEQARTERRFEVAAQYSRREWVGFPWSLP